MSIDGVVWRQVGGGDGIRGWARREGGATMAASEKGGGGVAIALTEAVNHR